MPNMRGKSLNWVFERKVRWQILNQLNIAPGCLIWGAGSNAGQSQFTAVWLLTRTLTHFAAAVGKNALVRIAKVPFRRIGNGSNGGISCLRQVRVCLSVGEPP